MLPLELTLHLRTDPKPYQGLHDVVASQGDGSPDREHNGEDASPDGQQGDDDEGGRGDCTDDVGPYTRAVQQLHAKRQLALEQRAVLAGHDDLEVALQ